jgi:hypothetical protein
MSERFSENSYIFKIIGVVGTIGAYVGYYFISNSFNIEHKFTESVLQKKLNKKNIDKKLNINIDEIKEDLFIKNLIENQKSYDIFITNFDNIMNELLLKIKIIKNINNNKFADIKNEFKGIRNTILSNTIRINKLENNKPEVSFFENNIDNIDNIDNEDNEDISIVSNNTNLLSNIV